MVVTAMIITLMPLQGVIVCNELLSHCHCHTDKTPQIKLNTELFSTGMPHLLNQAQKYNFLDDIFLKDPYASQTSCNCCGDIPISESTTPMDWAPIQIRFVSGILLSPIMTSSTQNPIRKTTLQNASTTFQSVELTTIVLIV